MSDVFAAPARSSRLDRVLHDLLRRAPELQAAAVVSFDGLPMASALPPGFDEDRVAAMSAALLSLGERASQGLGRGSLNQVYVEGEEGTVFLVSADDEAVLVAVGAHGAKVGLLLFEVRRGALAVAETLRHEEPPEVQGYVGHDVSAALPVHVAGHEKAHTPSYSNTMSAPAYPTYDGRLIHDEESDDLLPAINVPGLDYSPEPYLVDAPEAQVAEAEQAPEYEVVPGAELGSWATFSPGGSLSSATGQGLDPWI